jgi:hypothetical protein
VPQGVVWATCPPPVRGVGGAAPSRFAGPPAPLARVQSRCALCAHVLALRGPWQQRSLLLEPCPERVLCGCSAGGAAKLSFIMAGCSYAHVHAAARSSRRYGEAQVSPPDIHRPLGASILRTGCVPMHACQDLRRARPDRGPCLLCISPIRGRSALSEIRMCRRIWKQQHELSTQLLRIRSAPAPKPAPTCKDQNTTCACFIRDVHRIPARCHAKFWVRDIGRMDAWRMKQVPGKAPSKELVSKRAALNAKLQVAIALSCTRFWPVVPLTHQRIGATCALRCWHAVVFYGKLT